MPKSRRRSRAGLAVLATCLVATVLGAVSPAGAASRCGGEPTPAHRCTELVATTTTGQAAGTLGGAIAANGQQVAIVTANSSIPGGVDGQQVYVRSIGASTYRLASRATSVSGPAGNGPSFAPALNDDATVVAFLSQASNLALDGNGATADVFVRNLVTSTTTHVSRAMNPLTGANAPATQVAISDDGSTVAFTSLASNLVANDTNGHDVFVVDTDGENLRRGSTTSNGGQANGNSAWPALSADGRTLAFASDATNLVADDTNGRLDVFVKDLVSGAVERVSVATTGGQANGDSGVSGVSISADGRYVAFDTTATNLVPDDTNAVADIAVRDRVTNTTMLVGYASDAAPSSRVMISADGNMVVFGRGISDSGVELFVAGIPPREGLMRIDAAFDQSTGAWTPMPADSFARSRGISADGTSVLYEVDSALVADDANELPDLYLHVTDLLGPTIAAVPDVLGQATVTVDATLQGRGNRLEVRTATGELLAMDQPAIPSDAASATTTPLPDGTHVLHVREADPPYASPDMLVSVLIDTAPPWGLAVGSPADGATIGDPAPSIIGSAGTATGDDPHVEVAVRDAEENQIGETLYASIDAGVWTVEGPALPANGVYVVEVRQGDHAANVSSAVATFTLDVPVPTVAITSPAPGLTNTMLQTVVGTVSEATSVTLAINGVEHVVAASDGSWSKTVTFAEGTNEIAATASNVAGTGSSGSLFVEVDTVAPAAPTITAPTQNEVLLDATTTIVGQAEPHAALQLTLDGVAVVPAPVVDASGYWSHPTGSLAEGSHTVTARARDAAGNIGPQTSRSFIVDTQPPLPPVITSPSQGVVLPTSTVTFGGTAKRSATVRLYEGDTLLATTTATSTGSWQRSVVFVDGDHEVYAIQTDLAMRVSDPSQPVSFSVDTTIIVPTTITSPQEDVVLTNKQVFISGTARPFGSIQLGLVDGEAASPIGAVVPVTQHGHWGTTVTLNDGSFTVRATETTGGQHADRRFSVWTGIPVIIAPADGAFVPSTFTVSGTSFGNAVVHLRDGSTSLGSTTASPTGTWSMQVTRPQGEVTLIAHAGSGASRTGDSAPRLVTVDSTPPQVTAESDGLVMSTIAGMPPRVFGTATDPARVASVRIAYTNAIGQSVVTSAECPACFAATSVTYSDTPNLPTPGRWTAAVTATDVVGNVSIFVTVSFVALP